MKTELEMFLKLKNLFVPQDQINYIELKITEECECGYRRLGRFPTVQGGLHASDIAVVIVFASKINARQGFDWGWAQEYDNYHFNLGFSQTEKGRELMRMNADYNVAIIRSLQNTYNLDIDLVVQR